MNSGKDCLTLKTEYIFIEMYQTFYHRNQALKYKSCVK